MWDPEVTSDNSNSGKQVLSSSGTFNYDNVRELLGDPVGASNNVASEELVLNSVRTYDNVVAVKLVQKP